MEETTYKNVQKSTGHVLIRSRGGDCDTQVTTEVIKAELGTVTVRHARPRLSVFASAKKHPTLTRPIAWPHSSRMSRALGLPTLLHTPDNSPQIAVSSLALGDGKRQHGKERPVGWAGWLLPQLSSQQVQ